MKETICTIPINDVFGPKDGCPICRLYSMLEERAVEYVTGAAMMEPEVRVMTNEVGFCHNHFTMMVTSGKRLQNALLLESHLDKILTDYFPENIKGKPDKKKLSGLHQLDNTCYVCDRIRWGLTHMFRSIFATYEKDEDFRKLYNNQTHICLPHYKELMIQATNKGVSSKNISNFHKDTTLLAKNYLKEVKKDISHFCSMYDYRNNGGDWGNSKDAIERSIKFLTSKEI